MNHSERTSRRAVCLGLVTAPVLLSHSARALAQGGVSTVVIPSTPGGAMDTFGRIYAKALGAETGETFIVENVSGAGSAIGMARVVNGQSDGRMLLYTYGNLMLALTHTMKDAPNILRDFDPVMRTIVTQGLIVTAPSSSIRSFPDLLKMAAASPGKLTCVEYGGELVLPQVMRASGINLMRIPYKGGVPGMVDVMAGVVDVYAGSAAQLMPQVRAGKLRALAVSSEQRMAELPDVPTVRESLPEFRAMNYQGVYVRKGTPVAVIDALYKKSLAAMNRPEVKQQAEANFGAVMPMNPSEFRKFMEEDAVAIAAVMKSQGSR